VNKWIAAGITMAISFNILAADMKEQTGSFTDSEDTLTIAAIEAAHCSGVMITAYDEYVIQHVPVCLNITKVDELINSLEVAKTKSKKLQEIAKMIAD